MVSAAGCAIMVPNAALEMAAFSSGSCRGFVINISLLSSSMVRPQLKTRAIRVERMSECNVEHKGGFG